MKKVNIKDFGKDHWSLFAYVETRCVEHQGVLDKDHLRIKNPMISNNTFWKPEYGTRLSRYFLEGSKVDKTRQILDHDDLDCLEDLENAGLLENMGTGLNPAEKMTKFGIKVASLLRQHKAEGKMFATFTIKS